MNTQKRTSLASILIGSGFNFRKVLFALGFPVCTHIQSCDSNEPTYPPPDYLPVYPPPVDAQIYINNEKQEVTLTPSGKGLKINKALPILDYIQFTGTHIFRFHFNDGSQRKVIATNELSIPLPSNWTMPQNLKPKYPIPA